MLTLTINIIAKLAQLQSTFDRAAHLAERANQRITAAFGTLKSMVAGLAAGVSFHGFFSAFDEAIRKLDDLDERAQSLALPAGFLSALDLTARASGIDNIDQALAKFTATLADARSGSEKAERVVRALGISVADLRSGSLSVEQALREAADAVSRYADGFEKGNLVQEAFGARSQKLIALLNQGGEALDKFGGASRESIENAARLSAEVDKLAASSEKLMLAMAGSIAGAINRVLDAAGAQDTDRQLESVTKRVEQLKRELATQRNPEFLQAINIELAEAEERLARLSRASLDRFVAARAAINAAERRPRAPDVGEQPKPQKSEREAFIESLQRRLQMQQQGEFAALRIEAAQKKVAAAAEPYIAKLEQIKSLQQSIEIFLNDAARAERERGEEQAFDRGMAQRVRDLALEGELIGKNALEQAKLNAEREIAAQLDARLRASGDDQGAIIRALAAADRARAETGRTLETNAIRAQQQSLDALLADIEDETRLTGASNAERQRAVLLRALEASGISETADKYGELIAQINRITEAIRIRDEVRRQQQAFEDLGNAIAGSIENAIVKFDSFRNLLRAVEQDIVRIVTRNLVTEKLASWLTGALGGGAGGRGFNFSDFGAAIGRLFGGSPVGVFAAGTDFVPRTGWAMVHRGERIIPAEQNSRGMATNITINIAGSATRETANQIAAAVGRRLAIANARAF